MNIGIIGGSFDPVHDGHIQTALICQRVFDQIWLMPCGKHAQGKKLVPLTDRLAMCEIATVGTEIKTNTYDAKGSGSSLELWNRLPTSHTFSLIIGQDCADNIGTWINAKQLVERARFCIVPRKGYLRNFNDTAWYVLGKHRYLRDMDFSSVPEISSSGIRQHIQSGETPSGLHAAVWKYIKQRGFYGVTSK